MCNGDYAMSKVTATDSTVVPTEQQLDPGVTGLILELATGDRFPSDELNAEPAVLSLLAPVAVIAGKVVFAHGRKCHQKNSCEVVPPPLRSYLKMTREDTVLGQLNTLARALVNYPTHRFTDSVRHGWLEGTKRDDQDGQGIEEQIANGNVFTEPGLREFLGDKPHANAQRLALTLWARGLRDPNERLLFRLLTPIGAPVESADQAPDVATTEPRKAALDRKVRRDTKRDVEQLRNELKEAKRERRRHSESLARETSQRVAAAESLAIVEGEAQSLREKVDVLQRDLRLARGQTEVVERERNRAASAASALRTERDTASVEKSELELARSRAIRELSVKNREVEVLRARLAAMSTGAAAVHEFLVEEEDRIDQALQILQGGDRQRAEVEHAAHAKLEKAFLEAYPEFVKPRPAVIARTAELSIEPLGGADEVGRSAYLLRLGTHSILVDCGIKIGQKHLDELAPALDRVNRLDAVVLTHAHTDHVGWLPAVVRRFDNVPVYCTPETAGLVPIMLDDCHRHHLINMASLRTERAKSSNPDPIEDPYETKDVREAGLRLIGCEYGQPETLPFADIRITFARAGHILGAASVLIEGGNRRVLMSGDISTEPQLTVGTVDWSGFADELDLLVLESTYGDVVRDPLDRTREELVAFVRRTLEQGGSIILPCFALGRGQEVVAVLNSAMASGELPSSVTVWIDGMIRKVNTIYRDDSPGFRPSDNFVEVSNPADRMFVVEEARRQPVIIVSTSGMLAGGPAVDYARQLLPDGKNRIVFTGYQDEGNPGHQLLRLTREGLGARTVTVLNEEGKPVEIRATAPAKKFGLSAHADQAGLVQSAGSLNAKNILLVHGFEKTQRPLKDVLQQRIPEAEIVLGGAHEYPIP
jgi:Cft2 family RNA processing exonuclease